MPDTLATRKPITPFAWKDKPALIERTFPPQKISAEAQKERKAVIGQTLTALGSYWKGRKPLILAKSCVLGALLPATNDPEQDLVVFEKLMAIDNAALNIRFHASTKRFVPATVLAYVPDEEFAACFDLSNPQKPEWRDPDTIEPVDAVTVLDPSAIADVIDDTGVAPRWAEDAEDRDVRRAQRRTANALRRRAEGAAFARMPYDESIFYCLRPEELSDADLYVPVWGEVNAHLGTDAQSFPELIEQLGILRFGHRPRVGDTFCGAGSIPFEAARLGCDVYASDLNPIACLLTWGALHIVGGDAAARERIAQTQREIADAVDKEIAALGIEHDEHGNRAKAYLWCLEAVSPLTNGWRVPMATSWVISWNQRVFARLLPNEAEKRFSIEIIDDASDADLAAATTGTVQGSELVWQVNDETFRVPIATLRGDYRLPDGTSGNRLRRWERSDFVPRPDDVFQERLFCVQWITKRTLDRRHQDLFFAAPNAADLERERRVESIVRENLAAWQAEGLVPEMPIDPGDETTRLGRERGWTYWHHLFPPRHLLIGAIIRSQMLTLDDPALATGAAIGLCRTLNYMSKLTQWRSFRRTEALTGGLVDFPNHVFYNQALNTFVNYGSRAFVGISAALNQNFASCETSVQAAVEPIAAEEVSTTCDLAVSDPPYADAINYHEITEYFIAWLRRRPPMPHWIWDSRRALAIKGSDEGFRKGMVDAYGAMAEHMPDNGLQIVMFTHQDAGVWADMAQIMWGAGLQVTAAWYIATETTSELKKGGYVQGTVLLVLRKRQGDESAYKDELMQELRGEVAGQIDTMVGLNQRLKGHGRIENLFEDADLQMAGYAAALRVLTGYAAALRVLTGYTRIDGVDMTQEALRPRKKSEKGVVGEIIDFAVQVANEHLVPDGLTPAVWERLTGPERFYLKMLDIELTGAKKLDNYQNFAKAFRVGDYGALMGSLKPNAARLKAAAEFKRAEFGDTAFGQSVTRAVLYALYELQRETDVDEVMGQLHDLVKDYYTRRDDVIAVVRYLSQKREKTAPAEAEAARILLARIQSERLG